MKKVVCVMMMLAMILCIIIPIKSNAANNSVQVLEDGIYKIQSKVKASMYLDVSQASTENGANVQIWQDAKADQQRFKLSYAGNGYYVIKAVHSDKALDVAGAQKANCTNVWQYDYNGSDAQLWKIEAVGSGTYKIISKCNNLSLDISGGNSANGTNVQVFEWNGSNAQLFVFENENPIVAEKTIDDGIYRINTRLSNSKCLDIDGASKGDGANLQIWDKVDANQQKFEIKYLNNGYYKITAMHSNKVLDVAGAAKEIGTNVWQYASNGSDAQQWIIKKEGSYYRIISKCNGLSMDISGGKSGNGTNVQVFEWNGSNAQLFTFDKEETTKSEKTIEDGLYRISTKLNSNMYFDIDGGSSANGANLQIWQKTNVDQQKYRVTYLDNGYYKIIALHSGKVLEVSGGNKANGANICQNTSSGIDAQQWIIKKLDNGYYRIISKCGGLSVDVSGGNSTNGTNVQMFEWNGSNAQMFKFEKQEELIGKKTIDNGIYKIAISTSNKMLISVQDKSQENEANIYLNQDHEYITQKFKITYLDNGYYKIAVANTNKVLDVWMAGRENGTNVWLHEYNGSDAQQWIIKKEGDGSYGIVSKCSGLYIDVNGGVLSSGSNIQTFEGNGSKAQKFTFIKTEIQLVDSGLYEIELSADSNKVIQVENGSYQNSANIVVGKRNNKNNQKFYIEYIGSSKDYKITAQHSQKVMDVCNGEAFNGANVWQFESNNTNAQRWNIVKSGNYYTIKTKCSNGSFVLDVNGGSTSEGANIQLFESNNSAAQKFKLVETTPGLGVSEVNIDSAKYPLYAELISQIQANHPNWSIRLLYTGISFSDAVYGEYSYHGANLVPNTSGSEWICSVCGTKSYDTGRWYCASDTAIAYYMDPRNFINENSIYQFLDVNKYEPSSVSLEGIQANINGKFLEPYASDIDTACRNTNVNPYYVIARLIQENGSKGSYTSNGMQDSDGKIYYNPFNIGAYRTAEHTVKENALISAKKYGWDNMEKALEGGIQFLKTNWLDNYQNTLYQNRFDIDSTNGSSLYSHQYMQNLSGAYTEGLLLKSYYTKAGKTESYLSFIIPVYENMDIALTPTPSDASNYEEFPMNVQVNTQGSSLALRSGASTSSSVIARYDNGTVLLSVRRGVNSTWQLVVTKDGKTGYMSGEYLKQVDDEYVCNYKAYIKTQSSGGTNVRTGPSNQSGFAKVDYLPDNTEVTVIDDSTYQGYEGSEWCQWSRIILGDGRQAFVPSKYVIKK